MRKLIVLFTVTLGIAQSYAQEVKTKKDVVYIDKEAVANYSGFASAFKGVELNFTTMDNKPLFSIKQNYRRQKHPALDNKTWTDLIVSSDSSKISFLMDRPIFNDRKIIEDLIERTSVAIFDGDFSTLASIDESEAIIADSIRTVEFKTSVSNALKEGHRNREDEELKFKMKSVSPVISKKENSTESFQLVNRIDVYQGGEFIGWITKEKRLHLPAEKYRYSIYKNLYKEFTIGEETTSQVLAAQIELPAPTATIVTFQDFKEHKLRYEDEPKSDSSAEQHLIRWMVKEGYL
ncbi:MAG: hypothetical protein RLO81_14140 [Fulvivirga sp.]|uniref:hypothetical protein n=1 Tax=Fulvivirga sp. TaxID=1931237 RepID=UPI0032EC0E06